MEHMVQYDMSFFKRGLSAACACAYKGNKKNCSQVTVLVKELDVMLSLILSRMFLEAGDTDLGEDGKASNPTVIPPFKENRYCNV